MPGVRRGACVVVALVCGAAAASAETASLATLKGAFLYNFAKFTGWPAPVLPPQVPLVLCVAGDGQVYTALEDATRGREVEGHRLVVRRMDLDGPERRSFSSRKAA